MKITSLQKDKCTWPNHHEDHFAGKGDNSLQHYNLVQKCILMPEAMKIPDAKAAVENISQKKGSNCRSKE